MSKTFEPPYRRFAIRFTKDGNVSWWTDDGTGCDDARDYTEWDPKRLVTHGDRDHAIREVEALRKFARARGTRGDGRNGEGRAKQGVVDEQGT